MPKPLNVFISYAHKDGAKLASQLQADLTARGYDTWLDQARLQGGSNWSREIEEALDNADVVLALLSAGSFESEVCRGEQLRSLRHRKCVIPVLVHVRADRPVYLEVRQYRDFSEPELYSLRLEDLIRDIESRSGADLAPGFRKTRYDTVPPLPANFVSRPAELESLRQVVLSDRERRNVALVALRGMGGIGKTVLAQALCRDEAVQAAFPDGVLWVKVGEKPTDADLVGQMREAAKALGSSAEGFDTLEASSKLLRTLLKDKAALLVLDDVWHANHVYDFQPGDARFCRLLFTTRNAEIGAAIGAHGHSLDVLAEEQARRLLATYAGRSEEELPGEAAGILHECKGLPLALAMIGAMLREEPPRRWADVLDSLTRADLEEIRLEFPNYAYPSLVAAIEVSVKDLPPEVQRHYFDLAVLPEDTAIPETALEVLWELDGRTVRATAALLASRSLATRDTLGRLALHDLQLDYVRKRAGKLADLHCRLLQRYRKRCSGGWHTGPNDGYFFEHLAYHLKEGRRVEELGSLLLDSPATRTGSLR